VREGLDFRAAFSRNAAFRRVWALMKAKLPSWRRFVAAFAEIAFVSSKMTAIAPC
jgi:hypothetical protein